MNPLTLLGRIVLFVALSLSPVRAGIPFELNSNKIYLAIEVQERGPYRSWRHTHSFEDAAGGTMMRDRVEYALPFGALGELAHRLFVSRQLARIFGFRREVVATILGAPGAPAMAR